VARCQTIMAATETARQMEAILLIVFPAVGPPEVPVEVPEMDLWCSGVREGEVSMVSAARAAR